MLFKIDENLPKEVALALSQAGHDVMTVLDQNLGGEPDARIAQVCREESRILVSLDLDFADIRRYTPSEHAGLVVLRPRAQNIREISSLATRLLPVLETSSPVGELWIVEEDRIRIRA